MVQSLRKQSRGAQKTSSQYRGVTKHMKGKWEARIGQMVGRKYKWVPTLHAAATMQYYASLVPTLSHRISVQSRTPLCAQ